MIRAFGTGYTGDVGALRWKLQNQGDVRISLDADSERQQRLDNSIVFGILYLLAA